MNVKPIEGVLCKEVPAKCKFCGKALSLWIANDYDEVGDSMKIMKLAACNHCADLKTMQRKIESSISKDCGLLISRPDELTQTKIKRRLCFLTKAYLHTISEWLRREEPAWEEAIVDDIMERPNHVGATIKTMWAMAKEKNPKSMI